MPGKRINELPTLTGAGSAVDDSVVIFDTSIGATKQIARSQLATGLVGDLPYTPAGFISATTVPAAIAEIATDISASSGSSLVGFLQAGTGAVATTTQTKLREFPSVKDFGAVGDDSTLNDAAFALTEASALSALYLPDGTYKLGTINLLNKRYWGPGKIKFADGYIQAGVAFSDELPRNHVGNRVITSPTDIVLAPNGNVQFGGKRILNVGDPVGTKDVVNRQYLDAAIAGLYSKGTFTPVLEGETTAGTATYSLQYGRWTKLGDLVIVRIRLTWSGHTGTGSMYIPWTLFPLASPFISPPGTVTLTGDWTASGTGYLYSYVFPNKIYVAKDYQDGTANSLLLIQAAGTLDLQVIYEV